MPLTIKAIESARPGSKNWKLADEKGLYLNIAPTGSKRWRMKYRFNGKENKLSFGAYPEVGLKAAREMRDKARALLAAGKDPSHEKRSQKIEAKLASQNTFSAIAREFIDKRASDGDRAIGASTLQKTEWLLSLVEPKLGPLPVKEITTPLLLSVLQEIEESGRRETARRLRAFVGRVINHAIITGRAETNPALPLQRALKAPTVCHYPAIIDRGVLANLLRAIDGYSGHASTRAALRLTPHLFQRPGEIRTMKWSELDLDAAVWTIPPEKTKMRKEHQVPLSRQAISIIRSMEDVSAYSDYVFPSFRPKKPRRRTRSMER